jgi:hypothetical protein
MRTDYLTPQARHDRHRYQRAAAALHRLLGADLAEQVMEGAVPVEQLPEAPVAGGDGGGEG